MTPEQEKLITDHLHLLPKFLRNYGAVTRVNPLLHKEELLAEGRLALVQAALKFRADKNTSFETYANIRVTGRIKDYLKELDTLTRSERKRTRHAPVKAVSARRKGNSVPLVPNCVLTIDSKTDSVQIEKYHTHTPEKLLCKREILPTIRKMLLRQPQSFKIIYNRYIKEVSDTESGRMLGLTKTWVSVTNTKIIKKLRRQFKRKGITTTHQLL